MPLTVTGSCENVCPDLGTLMVAPVVGGGEEILPCIPTESLPVNWARALGANASTSTPPRPTSKSSFFSEFTVYLRLALRPLRRRTISQTTAADMPTTNTTNIIKNHMGKYQKL